GVVVPTTCAHCSSDWEDLNHSLFECQLTQEVWRLSGIGGLVDQFKQPCGWLRVRETIAKVGNDEGERFAVHAWLIWCNRNLLIFEGKGRSPEIISGSAINLQEAFKMANLPRSPNVDRAEVVRWQLPTPSSLKANFDAAVFKEMACGGVGVGVVIHDSKGRFVAGLAERIQGMTNPEIAEMIAARRAPEFGAKLNNSGFILEGDARRVISACLTDEDDLSDLGSLVMDTCCWIKHLQVSEINWTKRDGNPLLCAIS
ncbi:hypothetical protein ACH5RR_001012, partial [Cinchona calisaya]